MLDAEFVRQVILHSDVTTERFYSGSRYSFSFDPKYRHSDHSLTLYFDHTVVHMDINGGVHSATENDSHISITEAHTRLKRFKMEILGVEQDAA